MGRYCPRRIHHFNQPHTAPIIIMNIRLHNISKNFGKIQANEHISLTVKHGSIHGILGENGAGKSTLMKIVSGYIPKTQGQIYIDEFPVNYQNPAQACRHGIGMLYQDPLDFPHLSIVENYMLGQVSGRTRSANKFREEIQRRAAEFNFSLHPDTIVKQLTVGERQQLDLLRLFALGVQVLILDEPTTGISGVQKEILFNALQKMVGEGKSIILVSHKIEEVEHLCDTVTILRQGKVVGEAERPFKVNSLLFMMFGVLPQPPPKHISAQGKPVLEINGVSALGGRSGLNHCDITIRGGEIVGLAGLEGSGQGVFLRVAAGIKKPVTGEIKLNGKPITGKAHLAYKQAGVTFLPTARLEEGLISGLTIAEHTILQQNKRSLLVNWKKARLSALAKIQQYKIRGAPDTLAESLSGGNQQRLMLSFLKPDTALMLLENPTRGLDLDSTHWVWEQLQRLSSANNSIVFSSPETDEILMMSDRILVFFEGRILMDVKTADINIDRLSQAIAGRIE